MKRVLIVLAVAMFSVLVASAQGVDDKGQPNDPAVNERANACFEGGSLEGRCETDAEWTCGWYLIRWEADPGFERPEWCGPAEPVEVLVCDTFQTGVARDPGFFDVRRCATQSYGFDDWFADGSHDYLYYFGDYGDGCPAAPASHDYYSGPTEMDEFSEFARPPYNVTAPYMCTYQLKKS